MRKLKLLQQTEAVALTHAQRSCAPLAHAVHGEDGGRVERAGQEGAGGVAFVMVSEDQRRFSGHLKALTQRASHVQFVFQPERHRQAKTPEARRGVGKVSFQQPIEFRQRLVIKRDIAELFGA